MNDTLSVLRASHRWALTRFGQYLRSMRFWLVLIAAVLLVAIAGPFNTLIYMSTPTRLLYWVLMLVPSVLLQFYLSMTLREYARRSDRPWGFAALAAGAGGSLVILAWSVTIDRLIVLEARAFSFAEVAFYVITLTVALTMLFNAFMPTLQPLWGLRRRPVRVMSASLSLPDVELSPFFDRLPADLGREVISIRAANHHVEVTTTRGHARVLMRLADAEADLGDLPGMRVHRSWWVNLAHVSTIATRQGAAELVLTTGARVPVSRTLRPVVAAAIDRKAVE